MGAEGAGLERVGSFADIIKAIDYVTANAGEIEVVNMSLGGTGRLDSLQDAIRTSVAAGVVYVVAAGNSSKDVYGSDGIFPSSDDFIPAAYPEVMAVSALADFDGEAGAKNGQTIYFTSCTHTGDDVFACFTNYSAHDPGGANPLLSDGVSRVSSPGRAIDVAAPGVDILSTYPGGGTTWGSGTSMASPHVAGAAALEAATNGRAADAAGVADIRQTLIDAAEAQTDWGPENTKDPDNYPEGLVNAAGGPPPPPNDPPTVFITSPSGGNIFISVETVSFVGTANDTEDDDATLTGSIVWTSDINGAIGTGGSFSTTLSDGNHTITALVTDSGGKTVSVSVSITVGDPPVAADTVSVTSVSYATEGGKGGNKHLLITVALLDDFGDPVVSASVSIDLHRDGPVIASGTGTTGTGGTLTFSLKNARLGCYTTDVTDVTAAGLTSDGVTPDNEFCK